MGNARKEWEAMEADEQITMIKKMLWTAKKKLEARGALTVAATVQTREDVDSLTGAAWIKTVEGLDSTDGLALVAFRAATAAIMQEYRGTMQHPAASLDDPDIRQLPGLGASPEKIALDREAVAAVLGAVKDATDLAAVQHIYAGLTQEEIGKELNMTKQAVNYRLSKIREAARAALAE